MFIFETFFLKRISCPNKLKITIFNLFKLFTTVDLKRVETVKEMNGVKFNLRSRRDHGTIGTPIMLKSNFFQVNIPDADIHRYELKITPDKMPRCVLEQMFCLIQ